MNEIWLINDEFLFEEYINAIRILIVGHCSTEYELRQVFNIYDQNWNEHISICSIIDHYPHGWLL